MSTAARSWARGHRTPGVVHAAVAMILVIVVLLVAIPTHAQGPPSVAEYAPQPQQPIQQAPPEQNASLGKGEGSGKGPGGSGGSGGNSGQKQSTPPPVPGSQFHCVNGPGGPRQIDDPQSPPCVTAQVAHNGGATSKGVTGDSITVVMDTTMTVNQTNELLNFFSTRFDFYGRHLVLKTYTSSESCNNTATTCGNTTTMSTDAQGIDQTDSPFADLGYVSGGTGGDDYYFYDQLAERGILSVDLASHEGAPFVDESHLTQYAPFEWNYLPALDDDLTQLGQFICAQLKVGGGQLATYAGSPTNQLPRRFGLLVGQYTSQLQPDIETLTNNPCGVPFDVVQYPNTQQGQLDAVVALQQNKDTSVVCVCRTTTLSQGIFPAATSQNYFPEWVVDNYGVQDDDFLNAFYAEGSSPSQTQHMLGISGFNKWVPGADMPANWADEQINPQSTCPSGCYAWEYWATYWDLLVLASGIQMAGPDLTPATFQSGLFKTTFPNPGCGARPYYQGCVGFGPGDHTMIQDDAMIWWSNTAQEPYYLEGSTAPGAYCYIGLGRRWRNNWPTTPQAFFTSSPCQ